MSYTLVMIWFHNVTKSRVAHMWHLVLEMVTSWVFPMSLSEKLILIEEIRKTQRRYKQLKQDNETI